MARTSVLMCSEGTYPHYEGGVSVWCDQLINGLPHIDFRVFAITSGPNPPKVFKTPRNVLGVQAVPLWGTQEPGCQNFTFAETYQRRVRTSREAIQNGFLTPFRQVVRAAMGEPITPFKLGTALCDLHIYFSRFDFVRSMSSLEAWEIFLNVSQDSAFEGKRPTVHDATTCMRWLQRFLGILTAPLPAVDITHTSIAGLAGVPGILNKLLRGKPFIVSEHGIYLRELYLSLMRSDESEVCRRFLLNFHAAIVRANYHFADVITALGKFNKQWQLRLGASEEKTILTPNGVDPSCFHAVDRAPNPRPVVLTMARISRIKGIEFLLRAAAKVQAKVPSVLFRILGEPADAAYFERCKNIVSSLKLQDNVEFGATKQPASAYAAADVFCLPSISEGMPFSILEAMFSQCAVIASDVGNISEMLSGTGIIVPPADAESLARALISLLDGEGAPVYRRSLAQAALERAQTFYTSKRAISRFEDLYLSFQNEQRNSCAYLVAV